MDTIVGAGLSGLIAAHIWKGADVFDRLAEPVDKHAALLRFRTPDISNLTGIPFRKVLVRKAIWCDGKFREPTIKLANAYSHKVTGTYRDRSIWNLEPVERYIAPDDFYFRMLDNVGHRVLWNTPIDFEKKPKDMETINTSPLPTVCKALDLPFPEAKHSPIVARRYRFVGRDVDLFQTVYFPEGDGIYRVSISGSTLIVESVHSSFSSIDVERILSLVFAIEIRPDAELELVQESYGFGNIGKITPVDEVARRAAILFLTTNHRIFSFGRYGTWRNILLDDLIEDAERINRIVRSDMYETRLLNVR